MFGLRVPPAELRQRLNAEVYAPEHINAQHAVEVSGLSLKSLADVVAKPINNSIRNISGNLDGRGADIPMFRPADMAEGWLSSETAPKLDATFERTHKKSRVHPGDIVLGIAGTVGEIGRVPPGIRYGNINGSCARISPRDGTGGYLHAFLSGRYGQSALLRWCVGAVQKHLNLEDLPGVSVAIPKATDAQAYIGNKVRLASVLRVWARTQKVAAIDLVDGFFRIDGMDALEGAACFRVPAGILANRLDSAFYTPAAIALEDELHKHPRVATLQEIVGSRSITNGVRGPDLTSSTFKLVRLQDCRDWTIDFDQCLTISEKQFDENRRCRLQVGDVVIAIGGYIGNASIVDMQDTAVIGQHSAILPLHGLDSVDPYYLTVYLNSSIGAVQFGRYVSGGVQAGINLEDLREIRIPLPSEKIQQSVREHARRFVEGHRASRHLTMSARFLVEALIDRKVTEAELIAAYKDRDADRTLLARLATGGLDVTNADPLFPGLDRLEELLREAHQGDVE